MVTNKENLLKLGKKITDRIPYKLGLKAMDEECPEYWGMVNILDDEMVEVALKMKLRTPYSLKEMAKLTGKDEDYLYDLLTVSKTVRVGSNPSTPAILGFLSSKMLLFLLDISNLLI